MSTEAEEIQRIISASVRDMLDAFRIQASAGPVGDKALGEIIFRASHGVLESLVNYPGEQRVALLPSVVRLLLAAFLENVAGANRSRHSESRTEVEGQVAHIPMPRARTSACPPSC